MLTLVFNGPSPLGYELLLYLKLWWKYRHESNVLLIHYNDCINNLDEVTRKLIKFYKVSSELNENQIKKIVSKASFDNMKNMKDKFSYRLWGAPDILNGTLTAMKHDTQIRKGKNGDSNTLFSIEQLNYINKIVDDYFKDDLELLKWSKTGGPYT
jgi:hypothetical protein